MQWSASRRRPGAFIIFVATAAENLKDSFDLLSAIEYIFAKADAEGRACVINISLSQNLGSHDGETLVEQLIDAHLESEKGRAIVIAAGNENNTQAHAMGTLVKGQTRDLRVGIDPKHAAMLPTEIEIWHSSVDQLAVAVRCAHPKHALSPQVSADQQELHQFECGVGVSISAERFTALNGDSRVAIIIPEQQHSEGEWLVRLIPQQIRNGTFHAWIERPSGEVKQANFVGEGTEIPLTTITTPATARRGISVGNYVHREEVRKIHSSSGRGPTRDGRRKPDVAAPGTLVWSTNADGDADSARVQGEGTSMSAPHVTGLIALMFQKNPDLTGSQVKAILHASATPMGKDQPCDEQWGYGRVNAARALELTPEL